MKISLTRDLNHKDKNIYSRSNYFIKTIFCDNLVDLDSNETKYTPLDKFCALKTMRFNPAE